MTGSGTGPVLALLKMVTQAPFLLLHSFLVNMEDMHSIKKITDKPVSTIWCWCYEGTLDALTGVAVKRECRRHQLRTWSTSGMESSLVLSLLFKSFWDLFCVGSTTPITVWKFVFQHRSRIPTGKDHTQLSSALNQGILWAWSRRCQPSGSYLSALQASMVPILPPHT